MRKVYTVVNMNGNLYWGMANHWTNDRDDAREYTAYKEAVEVADRLDALVEETNKVPRRKAFASL